MQSKRIGKQTYAFDCGVGISQWATVAGPTEQAGRFGGCFDIALDDDLMDLKSWEQAECAMFQAAANCTLTKLGMQGDDVDLLLGGDLLNQIITAGFAARQLQIPFLGLYSACATSMEALGVAGSLLCGGFGDHILCAIASHFSTAERQYRTPLELGSDRPPTAQRTVTGAAAFMVQRGECPVMLTHFTAGKVVDWGIKDANNMGAAMAPAAADTVARHLSDLNTTADSYDYIVTGDLGKHGAPLFHELMQQKGYDLTNKHLDCGELIYLETQDVQSGGSGCACAPVVLGANFLDQLSTGKLRRILMVATGALLSPTSTLQGETIPSIAHAVVLEKGANG